MSWTPEQISALRKRIRESEDSGRILPIDAKAGRAADLPAIIDEGNAAPAATAESDGMGSSVNLEVGLRRSQGV